MPYIKKVCEDYDRLRAQLDELHGLRTGLIRIGTFSSVATHWLPNIIREFRRDYPNIDYELVLGDYTEIESGIADGRMDCGFLRLPARTELYTEFVEQDRLLAVLPEGHYLAEKERVSVADLCREQFIMLERGENSDVAEMFEKSGFTPRVHFKTWDDYAIMSMVESGLGISVLPELILRRIPYRVALRELEIPAYRSIGFAVRDKKTMPRAVKRFAEYLKYRVPKAE